MRAEVLQRVDKTLQVVLYEEDDDSGDASTSVNARMVEAGLATVDKRRERFLQPLVRHSGAEAHRWCVQHVIHIPSHVSVGRVGGAHASCRRSTRRRRWPRSPEYASVCAPPSFGLREATDLSRARCLAESCTVQHVGVRRHHPRRRPRVWPWPPRRRRCARQEVGHPAAHRTCKACPKHSDPHTDICG